MEGERLDDRARRLHVSRDALRALLRRGDLGLVLLAANPRAPAARDAAVGTRVDEDGVMQLERPAEDRQLLQGGLCEEAQAGERVDARGEAQRDDPVEVREVVGEDSAGLGGSPLSVVADLLRVACPVFI